MSKKSDQDRKRKFLLIHILSRIQVGDTPYDISKTYGWSKQRLRYWIKQLIEANFVRLIKRSTIALYELTNEGKNFYTQYVASFPSEIRLHNVSFIYPIFNHGNLTPDKEWNLKATQNKLKRESNASVVWNHKTLTINISSLTGDNAFDLVDKAKNISNNIAEKLEKEFNFKFGNGSLSRKPHFAVLDPLSEKISKHIEFTSDTAKMDKSEGKGELEFFEPDKVQKYIEMPERMDALENHLVKQTEIMDKFSQNLELHLKVLSGIEAGINELRNAIKELNG